MYYASGDAVALEFLAGYVVERALAVDNMFVFVAVFSYFAVPAKYQHRVLFYGIPGAILALSMLVSVAARKWTSAAASGG